MQLKDGFNITVSIIERMKEVFEILPSEQRSKCALCDETMTHVIKKIEAEAQVSNRAACRFMSAQTGKNESTIRSAVNKVQGKVVEKSTSTATNSKHIDIVGKVIEKTGTNDDKKGTISQQDAIRMVSKETGKSESAVKKQVQRAKSKSVFNKSDIEWCDFTWNPVTGCHHNCPYCYARGIATRFTDIFPRGFEYHVREERFFAPDNQPYPKPGHDKVFVCSMADLFGEWVEEEVITRILSIVSAHPEWTFIFLTKNADRLPGYEFPENAWVGVTVDKESGLAPALTGLSGVDALTKFISFEPLLEEFFVDTDHIKTVVDWVIIGCESGNRKGRFIPKFSYIYDLYHRFSKDGFPVFLKPNVALSFPQHLPRTHYDA